MPEYPTANDQGSRFDQQNLDQFRAVEDIEQKRRLASEIYSQIKPDFSKGQENAGKQFAPHLAIATEILPYVSHSNLWSILIFDANPLLYLDQKVEGNRDLTKGVVDFYTDNLQTVLEANPDGVNDWLLLYSAVRSRADNQQRLKINEKIMNLRNSQNREVQKYTPYFMFMDGREDESNGERIPNKSMQEGYEMAATELRAAGFTDPEKLIAIWSTYPKDNMAVRNIATNLNEVRKLEGTHPGMAARVNQDGLVFFERYSEETIALQDKYRNNEEVGYVFLVNPFADDLNAPEITVLYNQMFKNGMGAFAADKVIYDKLAKKLDSLGFAFRICEIEKTDDGWDYIEKNYDKYGATSTLILGGHGEGDIMGFGRVFNGEQIEGHPHLLSVDDIKAKKEGLTEDSKAMIDENGEFIEGEGVLRFIAPGGTVLMISCSTGQELAPEISTLGYETIAPMLPATVEEIDVDFDPEFSRLHWDIDFKDSFNRNTTARFFNGKAI